MSALFEPLKLAEIAWREGLPYAITFEDTYFANQGGLDEAHHVFLDGNHLIKRWQALSPKHSQPFVLAELGFGTGRNFLLAWSLWKKHAPDSARLHFISCEKHPLSRQNLSKCLALWPDLQEEAGFLLDNYPILTPGFHLLQFDGGRVSLTLMLGDAHDCYRELLACGDVAAEKNLRESYVDAWFLDGFSPTKNPLMWSEDLFVTLGMLSKNNTTLAAFTTADAVKERLQSAGFNVSASKEKGRMIAEFKGLTPRHATRHTPWHLSSPKIATGKKALVLGAGLAGCYTANALAQRGWRVTILDAQKEAASGASGNQHAILFPQLSSFFSPVTAFMLTTYLYAIRYYKQVLGTDFIGELSGMLQLAYNHKEHVSQANLHGWLSCYPELGALVNAADASAIAGIVLQYGGLFIPHSGWFDSPALCRLLLQKPGIQWEPNTLVTSLDYDGREWHANGYHAEVVVIANGYQANAFAQTAHVPLKAVRGQMTFVLGNEQSARLKVPVCGDGHIIPARGGIHSVGATYYPGVEDMACYEGDDNQNITKFNSILTEGVGARQIAGHWAGVRAVTPDYLPLVGPVANAEGFRQQFASLATDSKRWIPLPGVYHDGLYVCAGFGSRGLTTIPLSAQWLAAIINKELGSLPRTMVQSLSPARFLRRDIIRKCRAADHIPK